MERLNYVLIVALIGLVLSGANLAYSFMTIGVLSNENRDLRIEVDSLTDTVGLLANISGYEDVISRAELLKEARKEGKLVIYSGVNTESIASVVAAFKIKYPWIDVSYWKGGSASIGEKVESEIAAGKLAASVVDMDSTAVWYNLKEKGHFMSYKSPNLKYYDEQWYDPDGYWSSGAGLAVACIGINTDYIPAGTITSWTDVLNETYKGHVGICTPYLSGNAYIWYYMLRKPCSPLTSPPYGLSYMEQLVSLEPKQWSGHGTAREALVSGEVWILAETSLHHMYYARAQGAPIEYIIPQEGTCLDGVGQVVAILEDGPHPNCAKLYVDFLLSYEGQEALILGTSMSLLSAMTNGPSRMDVPTISDLNLVSFSVDDTIAKFDQYMDEYKQLMGIE